MRRASTTCISSASAQPAFPVSTLHLSFMLDISNISQCKLHNTVTAHSSTGRTSLRMLLQSKQYPNRSLYEIDDCTAFGPCSTRGITPSSLLVCGEQISRQSGETESISVIRYHTCFCQKAAHKADLLSYPLLQPPIQNSDLCVKP